MGIVISLRGIKLTKKDNFKSDGPLGVLLPLVKDRMGIRVESQIQLMEEKINEMQILANNIALQNEISILESRVSSCEQLFKNLTEKEEK